jgi:predicted nucleic acid-binding protein
MASGSPIPANDAWIAALARQHRMLIVSRDIHFDRVKNIERLAWRPKRWNTAALQSASRETT